MKNTKAKSSIKTKIIAAALAATCIFSTVSMTAASVCAAEISPKASSSATLNSVSSITSDALFSGASTLISVISKTNPITAIISNGLLGAFKNFYGSATKTAEPTTKDIVNMLSDLSKNINDYHNDEMQQLHCLADIAKLGDFSSYLNKILGHNQVGLSHLAKYKDNLSKQDYKNIINSTSSRANFTSDFIEMSNLIIKGAPALKGNPSFLEYINLAKDCTENNHDYDLVKKDAQAFTKLTMEQYALSYCIIMTGYNANYKLQELNYNDGEISLETKKSIQDDIMVDMELYTDTCKKVIEKYLECENTIKNMKTAEITVNGKTTSMYSFADAWVEASESSGSAVIKLFKDWKADDLSSDINFHKANTAFKNGSLYLKDHSSKVTIDLNGHSIIHTNNKDYDIYLENSNLEIKDSAYSKNASTGGISSTKSTLNVNRVTVKNSASTGISVSGGTVNISNATISGCKNSGIVNTDNGRITVNNSTISGNKQTGICNKSGSITVEASTLSNNSSDGNGGAVYNTASLTINNCTISDNSAKNGGGVYSDNDWKVSGSTFRNNSASNNGGAICNDYYGCDWTTTNKIDNCTFKNNNAGNFGGAVYADSMCYLTIYDSSINGNKAGNQGGGLYAQKGSGSSCDPVIGGLVNITGNSLSNGTNNNAFLGENSTSKCVFRIFDSYKLNSSSKIGITSNTSDKSLDIVKIFSKAAYESAKNSFSYDTSAYKTNPYSHWYNELWWVEIVKN